MACACPVVFSVGLDVTKVGGVAGGSAGKVGLAEHGSVQAWRQWVVWWAPTEHSLAQKWRLFGSGKLEIAYLA